MRKMNKDRGYDQKGRCVYPVLIETSFASFFP